MKQIVLDGEISRYVISPEGIVHGSRGLVTPIVWCQGRYLMYSFNLKGRKVRRLAHRLVAEYCLSEVPENIEDYQVNHKDGNKFNNDPNNLEWVTIEENVNHEFETGLSSGKCYRRLDAFLQGQYYATYPSINQASKATGVNSGNIHQALKTGGCMKGFTFVESR